MDDPLDDASEAADLRCVRPEEVSLTRYIIKTVDEPSPQPPPSSPGAHGIGGRPAEEEEGLPFRDSYARVRYVLWGEEAARPPSSRPLSEWVEEEGAAFGRTNAWARPTAL